MAKRTTPSAQRRLCPVHAHVLRLPATRLQALQSSAFTHVYTTYTFGRFNSLDTYTIEWKGRIWR